MGCRCRSVSWCQAEGLTKQRSPPPCLSYVYGTTLRFKVGQLSKEAYFLFFQLFVCVFLQVEWPVKLHIAQGVVHGMNYLHTKQPAPVIHGDLKVQNVLIADAYVAKASSVSVHAKSD